MSVRKGEPRETFAEIVFEVPASTGATTEHVSLIWNESFVDDMGVTWLKRGGKNGYLDGKAIEKLLLRPDVRLIHEYFGRAQPPYEVEVPADQREGFWADALASMKASEDSDFYGGEFKNDLHEHLLIVHEDC